jgi:DNA polymerase sigma
MESKIKLIKVNSNDFQPVKDRFILISLSHKFKTEDHLLKIKAPDYISKFFQEISDHECNLNIGKIISWYSKLDEQTKTVITSFNSSELIQLLRNEIINDKTSKTKPAPKDELKTETKNIKTSNFDDIPTQELFYQEQYESESDLVKDTEFQNLKSNEETTKDTENEEEQYINKNLIKEEDWSKITIACSLEGYTDTLIFNTELSKLEECLNCFPKEYSTIRPIIPKLINNTWHITLPDWTNLLETLSFCQIMACVFILLHYEYYFYTGKTYEMPFYKELRGISQDNELIINKLFRNKVDVNDIFSEYNSFYIAKKCTYNYIKRYIPKDQNFDSDELFNFNINILKNLKKEISKYNANKEKLKILFRKISFYSLEDIINSKHFTYYEIKIFLINYNGFPQEIDATYRNIQYNNKILEPIRKEYLEKTKRLLKKILGPQIEIVEYGSSFTGLSTELSDIDILIYDEKIKDEIKYGENLQKVLGNENLNIEAHLENKNAPPVITISYDISEEYLTGINFSGYLDGIKDLKKIKIDITFTNNKERVKNTKETVRIIKETLKRYKQLKPIILYLKIFFKKHELYSTYKGGINSLSVFCIARNILVTYEKYSFDVNLFPKEQILFLITEKFGNYKYQYGIDKDGFDYTLKDKEIVKNQKDLRLVIKNPIDNEKNIAEGSFRSNQIIEKFYFLFINIKKSKTFS